MYIVRMFTIYDKRLLLTVYIQQSVGSHKEAQALQIVGVDVRTSPNEIRELNSETIAQGIIVL